MVVFLARMTEFDCHRVVLVARCPVQRPHRSGDDSERNYEGVGADDIPRSDEERSDGVRLSSSGFGGPLSEANSAISAPVSHWHSSSNTMLRRLLCCRSRSSKALDEFERLSGSQGLFADNTRHIGNFRSVGLLVYRRAADGSEMARPRIISLTAKCTMCWDRAT